MIFDSWSGIGRILLIGFIAYTTLILLLRTSGKRTLSKMNAFDFVITVALGSTLSTILVSRDVPLAEGVVALALLIALQYAVAWGSVRFPRFQEVVKSTPSLLLFRGELRPDQLRRQRVSEEEVRAAARSAGVGDLSGVGAVILETDGSFSVIQSDALQGAGALRGIDGFGKP